jgi:hypothetical protein
MVTSNKLTIIIIIDYKLICINQHPPLTNLDCNNIKTDINKTTRDDMDWINLAQKRVHWWVILNSVNT